MARSSDGEECGKSRRVSNDRGVRGVINNDIHEKLGKLRLLREPFYCL